VDPVNPLFISIISGFDLHELFELRPQTKMIRNEAALMRELIVMGQLQDLNML
jgi:hypothetical protein